MKLKFKFVDRYDERNILKKYFSNNNIREQGVWISGPHNIGKTELVKETINYLKNKTIFHIMFTNDEYSYIEHLLSVISDYNQFKGNDFFSYLSIKDTRIDSKIATAYGDYHNSGFLKRLEISRELINNNKIRLLDILIDYFNSKNISGIVFDDFEYCDYNSVLIIKQLISELVTNTDIAICFITNNEVILSEHVSAFLMENLDIMDLPLSAFDDVFFYDEFVNSCEGIPKNLFLQHHLNRFFSLNNGNIGEFKNDILQLRHTGNLREGNTYAIEKYIKDKEQNKYYFFDNDILKIIVMIALMFQCSIYSDIFLSTIKIVYSIEGTALDQVKIRVNEYIDMLINEEIFYINNDSKISIKNYYITNELFYYFKNHNFILFRNFSQTILTYIDLKIDLFNEFSSVELNKIKYNCNLILNGDSIIKYTFELVEYYYENNKHEQIQKMAIELNEQKGNLSPITLLKMADSLYLFGNYKLALEYIESIKFENVGDIFKINLYILRGKLKFILLINSSIDDFEKAKEISRKSHNTEKLIETINLLFMAYSENRETLQKARNEYLYGLKLNHECIQYAKLCRNALNVFEYNKALPIMIKGKKIARKFSDQFEEMKCSHNIAFFKTVNLTDISDICEIKNEFKNITTFFQANGLPHESAYALNDYAVILMIQGDYEKAENLLRKAKVLACSTYSKYTINCNLLISCLFPEQYTFEEAKTEIIKYYNSLKDNDIVDDRILRKNLINFAIIMQRYNNYEMIKFFLDECRTHLGHSPSIARFNKICNEQQLNICTTPYDLPKTSKLYYKELSFEPWLLSFGHD